LETLILTDNEVKSLLSLTEVMEAVESAFKEKGLGRVQMPAKTYLYYKKYHGDLRTMPTFLEDLDVSAVKVVNVHTQNSTKNNFPTVMAVITLIDPSTGAPIAIIGGTTISRLKNGIVNSPPATPIGMMDSLPKGGKKYAIIRKISLPTLSSSTIKYRERMPNAPITNGRKNFVSPRIIFNVVFFIFDALNILVL